MNSVQFYLLLSPEQPPGQVQSFGPGGGELPQAVSFWDQWQSKISSRCRSRCTYFVAVVVLDVKNSKLLSFKKFSRQFPFSNICSFYFITQGVILSFVHLYEFFRKAFTLLTKRLVFAIVRKSILLRRICTQTTLFVIYEKAWEWGIIFFCAPGSGKAK